MVGMSHQAVEVGRHAGRRTWGVGIARIAKNPQHSVLGDGATGPGGIAPAREPAMAELVVNVLRIEKGNQNIDVQEGCRFRH